MKNTNNEELTVKENFNYHEDFNFLEIWKLIKSNFKLILTVSMSSLILSTIVAFRLKPTWQGEFQIVLENIKGDNKGNPDSISFGLSSINKVNNNKTTQVGILKSPLVMKDIFYLFKDLGGDKTQRYKEWLKNSFDINLEDDSDILTVKYRDKDLVRILPILELVSSKYQKYSALEENKSITNVINYLNKQIKNQKADSQKSLLALQEFSLKNSVGGFDGFFPLELQQQNKENNDDNNNNDNDIDTGINKINPAKRYTGLFALLEEAEAELISKSTFYKEDSEVIFLLNKRIKSLKEALQRPREILIEYRNLQRKAASSEQFLYGLEQQLTLKEIERERESIPWKLVTKPTLDEIPYAPNKKQFIIFWSFIGFLVSILITLTKEDKKKLIFTKIVFENIIPFKFLKSIILNKGIIDSYSIDIISKNCFKDKSKIYNLIIVEKVNKDIYHELCLQISKYLNQKNIFVKDDLLDIDENVINYLIVKSGSTKRNELNDFLEDINFLNIAVSGWFLINND